MFRTSLTKRKVPVAVCVVMLHLYPASAYADYYEPTDVGSDSLYNPLSSAFHYSLDALQIRNAFDHRDFDDRMDEVIDELTNPDAAINAEGGYKQFINRQVLPIDLDRADDWPTMLPNYFLHLLGGGMVYRRDLEYFRYHGYEHPQASAIGIAVTTEFVQEVFEKRSSTSDDAIADMLLFRPLGVWLFSDDERAAYIEKTLNPDIWPNLVFYDPDSEAFRNTGISYIYRPRLFDSQEIQPFVYTGITTLFGLSHRFTKTDTLSWGIGAALTYVDVSDGQLDYDSRHSFGLFHDRRGSLLWSLLVNGTENLKVRINVYPFERFPAKTGIATGLTDDHQVYLGVTLNTPIGLGSIFD